MNTYIYIYIFIYKMNIYIYKNIYVEQKILTLEDFH